MPILVAHLLKWQFQPTHRSSGWRGLIAEQRVQIERWLRLSPSLKPWLAPTIAETYAEAVALAAEETGLAPEVFPTACPWSPAELRDRGFLPD